MELACFLKYSFLVACLIRNLFYYPVKGVHAWSDDRNIDVVKWYYFFFQIWTIFRSQNFIHSFCHIRIGINSNESRYSMVKYARIHGYRPIQWDIHEFACCGHTLHLHFTVYAYTSCAVL